MTNADLYSERDSRRSAVIPICAVWLLLTVYSFCHAPVPGVNEPHYLAKARHYWNPDWCRGDFFLESSNPHLVFYQTIGWLTAVTSLPAAAIAGRLAALLLLAAALQRLAHLTAGDRWRGVTATVCFLFLQGVGNLSGEWMVGGVEGKVISYACVLQCLCECIHRRWTIAGPWLGTAIAFHPLVGLWSLTALGMTAALGWAASARHHADNGPHQRSVGLIAPRELLTESFVIGAILLVCLAAWGVLPALDTMQGATPRENFAATYLQVFFRLKHHVDPMDFSAKSYVLYAGLSLAAFCLKDRMPQTSTRSLLNSVVFCAGLIALCGIVAGFGDRPPVEMPGYAHRMKLLKFYPFRLFDALLPLLVGLQAAGLFSRRRLSSVLVPARVRRTVLFATFLGALWLNAGWGSINRMNPRQESDWRAACEWIRCETPPASLFLTPDESWAFKWFAQRPEFVARKDCPQDARGIIEWNRRLNFIRKWGQENLPPTGYTAQQAQDLSAETGITHILSRRFGPFDLPVVYRNSTYRIYEIPSAR